MSIVLKGELPNPYSHLFIESLPRSVEPIGFSWLRSLLGRYDVFHIHWPETLIRDNNPLKRLLKRMLLPILILRLRVLRIPVVRTVHNESPHDSYGSDEKWLLSIIDYSTDHWIVMNSGSPTPSGKPRYKIPHGHYRRWYNIPHNCPVNVGSVIFFGEIRAYKNVVGLCEAFLEVEAPRSAELKIMGRPDTLALEQEIRTVAEKAPNIRLCMSYISSSELVNAIASSHLVVLPYTRFHNSGAALLALSVGRPILVPESQASRELLEEFGSEYIYLFRGPFTASRIETALREARASDLPKPDMSRREWSLIGEEIGAVYRTARKSRHTSRFLPGTKGSDTYG